MHASQARAGGRFLASERGAFNPTPVVKERVAEVATAPFEDFLKTTDEKDWIAALFVRLASSAKD